MFLYLTFQLTQEEDRAVNVSLKKTNKQMFFSDLVTLGGGGHLISDKFQNQALIFSQGSLSGVWGVSPDSGCIPESGSYLLGADVWAC